MLKIHPFLWFDDKAEEAMRFYCSIFPNSKVNKVSVMPDTTTGEPGDIMTVECELDGLSVTALNAGPGDPFNTSMSLYVETADQAETDKYWNALLADGGVPKPCGWLVDKFGVYWQVAPRAMLELFDDPDRKAAARAFGAMLNMGKIELKEIERAFRGK